MAAASEPWTVTWAVLELVEAMASHKSDHLHNEDVVPALCFLRFSPDDLEGQPARETLKLLTSSEGENNACEHSDRMVRSYKERMAPATERAAPKRTDL